MPGVTSIKLIRNLTDRRVEVHDHENPTHAGNNAAAPPGASAPCEMWVLWCVSGSDFANQKYIVVSVENGPTYWIWQAQHDDEDAVRCGTTGRYENPGTPITGLSLPGGDRVLDVTPTGLHLHV
jgi:hypothetical protein